MQVRWHNAGPGRHDEHHRIVSALPIAGAASLGLANREDTISQIPPNKATTPIHRVG